MKKTALEFEYFSQHKHHITSVKRWNKLSDIRISNLKATGGGKVHFHAVFCGYFMVLTIQGSLW